MKRAPDMIDYMLVAGALLLVAFGLGLVAWLYHGKADGGTIGAVTTLLASIVAWIAGAFRNRFPGPEIEVDPNKHQDGGPQ